VRQQPSIFDLVPGLTLFGVDPALGVWFLMPGLFYLSPDGEKSRASDMACPYHASPLHVQGKYLASSALVIMTKKPAKTAIGRHTSYQKAANMTLKIGMIGDIVNK
jgi:hypothetical protein